MSKDYTPADWYWIVGGDESKVYSSKSGDYVPVSDAAYQAWTSDGTVPTRTDSAASLGQTLSALALRPTANDVLSGYLDAEVDNIIIKRMFRILFNHENRIRAIERQLGLNGSPNPLTVAQARAAFRSLL